MPVIVDACFVIALGVKQQPASAIAPLFEHWVSENESIHAPDLLDYEIASALTRLVRLGQITRSQMLASWQSMRHLPIERHPIESIVEIVDIALQLQRQSSYDAAYLALSRRLDADLWTVDGPLARNALGLGFPVHLVTTG